MSISAQMKLHQRITALSVKDHDQSLISFAVMTKINSFDQKICCKMQNFNILSRRVPALMKLIIILSELLPILNITNKATLINEYPTVDKYNKLQLQLLLCDMEKKTQKTVTELNIPFKLSTLSTIQSLRNQSTPKSTYNAWFSINDKANVFKDFNGYKIGMYWKDKNINTKQVKKKDESPVLIAVGKWNLTSKSKAPFDMVHIHKDRASDTEFGLIIDTSHARAKGAYKLKVKIITKKKKNVKDYLIFSCDYASCAVSNTNYSINPFLAASPSNNESRKNTTTTTNTIPTTNLNPTSLSVPNINDMNSGVTNILQSNELAKALLSAANALTKITQPQPQPLPQIQPQTQPQPLPQIQPQTQPLPQTQTQPLVQPQPQPQHFVQPQPQHFVQPQSHSQQQITQPNTHSNTYGTTNTQHQPSVQEQNNNNNYINDFNNNNNNNNYGKNNFRGRGRGRERGRGRGRGRSYRYNKYNRWCDICQKWGRHTTDYCYYNPSGKFSDNYKNNNNNSYNNYNQQQQNPNNNFNQHNNFNQQQQLNQTQQPQQYQQQNPSNQHFNNNNNNQVQPNPIPNQNIQNYGPNSNPNQFSQNHGLNPNAATFQPNPTTFQPNTPQSTPQLTHHERRNNINTNLTNASASLPNSQPSETPLETNSFYYPPTIDPNMPVNTAQIPLSTNIQYDTTCTYQSSKSSLPQSQHYSSQSNQPYVEPQTHFNDEKSLYPSHHEIVNPSPIQINANMSTNGIFMPPITIKPKQVEPIIEPMNNNNISQEAVNQHNSDSDNDTDMDNINNDSDQTQAPSINQKIITTNNTTTNTST
eukprot:456500_1